MKIDIFLEEKSDIYHPFSVTTLNPELASYIYDECIGQKKHTPIELEISSKEELNDYDKEIIEMIIKNHFIQEIDEEKMNDTKSLIGYISLAIIGCFFVFLGVFIKDTFFSEIFNIIGWLGIWELISRVVFEEGKERIRIHRYKEIIRASIVFK